MTAATTSRPWMVGNQNAAGARPSITGNRNALGPQLRPSKAREKRKADRAPLDRALSTLLASEVPCRAGRVPPETWVAERAVVQRAAAVACLACPALELCREYVLAHRREAGVYGGLTERDRTPAKFNQTDEEDAP